MLNNCCRFTRHVDAMIELEKCKFLTIRRYATVSGHAPWVAHLQRRIGKIYRSYFGWYLKMYKICKAMSFRGHCSDSSLVLFYKVSFSPICWYFFTLPDFANYFMHSFSCRHYTAFNSFWCYINLIPSLSIPWVFDILPNFFHSQQTQLVFMCTSANVISGGHLGLVYSTVF